MSWHGPSFCADSSVTLGDPVKFISAVSPNQLAGFPSVLSTSPRWFLSPVAMRETEFIANSICRFLIPYRGTCGSDKSLNTSNSSLGRLPRHGLVIMMSALPFLCEGKGICFYSNFSVKSSKEFNGEYIRVTVALLYFAENFNSQ